MTYALWIPFLAQAALMFVDELYFHRRRGLPTWEIWGHPIDTLGAFLGVAYLLWATPGPATVLVFAALATGSALLATKDEFVHLKRCEPGEQWVHAALFQLHAAVFFCSGLWWWNRGAPLFLEVQAAMILLVFAYQVAYWGIPWLLARSTTKSTTTTATAGTPPSTIR